MRSETSVLTRGRASGCTAVLLALALATSGCETASKATDAILGTGAPPEGMQGHVTGFLGGVVADEPRAALAARGVLSAGGTAADAAVALGFTLAVTMPSRAGLGGGGACLAYDPDRKSVNAGVPEAILFLPQAARDAAGGSAAGDDRPAALPMLARGLFALHARYGRQPFEGLVAGAEQLARFGTPVSRAFAADLALVAGPLFVDPGARAIFSRDGAPLAEGQTLTQPDLGSVLAQVRVDGVGDLYQGQLARRLQQASPLTGGALSMAGLRTALPQAVPVLNLPDGRDRVAFLPLPADGGLAAAAAFGVLQRDPGALQAAEARALSIAARYRSTGGDASTLLATADPGSAALPSLPASTGFITLDRDGRAVACTLTMNNLFGTGRVVPGMGLLLAASPARVPTPLLSAAIDWNSSLHGFRAAVTGTGQAGAPLAAAAALMQTLRSGQAMPQAVPEPGRANVITCSRYLPDNDRSCSWAADPRGAGLAVGSN